MSIVQSSPAQTLDFRQVVQRANGTIRMTKVMLGFLTWFAIVSTTWLGLFALDNLFDLPTAIRKVTSDPADAYGISDRGQLTPGAWADMILFDPETISITNMERHFDLPAGGERLLRRAPGLKGTWVNGVQVFDGENYLDVEAPGEVLTKFSGGLPTLGMATARAAAE